MERRQRLHRRHRRSAGAERELRPVSQRAVDATGRAGLELHADRLLHGHHRIRLEARLGRIGLCRGHGPQDRHHAGGRLPHLVGQRRQQGRQERHRDELLLRRGLGGHGGTRGPGQNVDYVPTSGISPARLGDGELPVPQGTSVLFTTVPAADVTANGSAVTLPSPWSSATPRYSRRH